MSSPLTVKSGLLPVWPVECENLSCLDLSHNRIDDPDVINVFERMKKLVNGILSYKIHY